MCLKIISMTKSYLDDLTYRIVGAAIEVYKNVGAGLLESVYHRCLMEEFKQRGIQYRSELNVPIDYKGIDLDANLRCDFLVEEAIVVELKAVDLIAHVFEAHLLTYMKLLKKLKGILINLIVLIFLKKVNKLLLMSTIGYCLTKSMCTMFLI